MRVCSIRTAEASSNRFLESFQSTGPQAVCTGLWWLKRVRFVGAVGAALCRAQLDVEDPSRGFTVVEILDGATKDVEHSFRDGAASRRVRISRCGPMRTL